jgi:hypothetical protein
MHPPGALPDCEAPAQVMGEDDPRIAFLGVETAWAAPVARNECANGAGERVVAYLTLAMGKALLARTLTVLNLVDRDHLGLECRLQFFLWHPVTAMPARQRMLKKPCRVGLSFALAPRTEKRKPCSL